MSDGCFGGGEVREGQGKTVDFVSAGGFPCSHGVRFILQLLSFGSETSQFLVGIGISLLGILASEFRDGLFYLFDAGSGCFEVLIETSRFLQQLLYSERIFCVGRIVSVYAVFSVGVCILADVFDVWSWLRSCCGSDYLLSVRRRGKPAPNWRT